MSWQEKFNNEIFDVINRYENTYDIKIDAIKLESKPVEDYGEKTVNVSSSFTKKELPKQEVKKGFTTSVLLPSVLTFIVLAILMELFF